MQIYVRLLKISFGRFFSLCFAGNGPAPSTEKVLPVMKAPNNYINRRLPLYGFAVNDKYRKQNLFRLEAKTSVRDVLYFKLNYSY
jgi:hypothetical protein